MSSQQKNDPTVVKFYESIRFLLSHIERKCRSDLEAANIDRFKKRISILKQTGGDSFLIKEVLPFFVEYSDKIISRDEQFFLEMNARSEFTKRNGAVGKQDEFIFDLINSIRKCYVNSTTAEKDTLYANVKNMFDSAIEYGLNA